jgi:cytochrome c
LISVKEFYSHLTKDRRENAAMMELGIMFFVQSARKTCLLVIGLALSGAIGLTALPGSLTAQAVKNADPVRGQDLARRLCANCHATEPKGGQAINPDVPSFSAISRQPNVTAERLAGRIIVPHPAMPNTQLTVAEIRDVIAYILGLKDR